MKKQLHRLDNPLENEQKDRYFRSTGSGSIEESNESIAKVG
jgi:hypothetical protein